MQKTNVHRLWRVGALNVVNLLFLCFFHCVESGNEQFSQPENHVCACLESVLTFNCTTIGLSTTIWTGTAFDCRSTGNQITLRNFQFDTGSFGSCNDGKIAAKGVEVNGECHKSQLNVTISPGLNQSSIECKYNSDQGIVTIGQAILTVLQSDYPPPGNVMLARTSPEGLTFTWNAIAPVCSSIQYRINASNCGRCPTEIMTAQATCTDLLSLTEKQTCSFSVQNVVCGTAGNQSSPLLASIGVPGTPQVMITPYYFNDTQDLSILIRNHSIEMNTDIILIDQVTAYNVHINFSSGLSVNYSNITFDNDGINVSSFCSSTAMLSIVISAINVFGEGPPSSPIMIGCTNQFVKLKYAPSSSTLSCQFLTPPDTSELRSCSVRYKKCQEEQSSPQTVSMKNVTANPIALKLSVSEGNSYCFVVTASNITFNVRIGGNITIPAKGVILQPFLAAAITVITVTTVMVCLMILIIIIITAIVMRKPGGSGSDIDNMRPIISYRQFSITWNPLAESSYKTFNQFCEQHNLPAVLFLKYERQSIPKDDSARDVIVFKQNKMWSKDSLEGKLFTGPFARDKVSPEGHQGIHTTDDILFVLWKDTESIKPRKDGAILHQNPNLQAATFRVLRVDSEKDNNVIEMNTFVKKKLKLCLLKAGNVFYEVESDQPENLQYYKEVLHVPEDMLKQDTFVRLNSHIGHFYDIPGVPGDNVNVPTVEKCRVFLQSTTQEPKSLKAGSWLLYKK